MPPSAYNRLADNWRPLFAIAQTAGGDWPRRALEAFNQLANPRCNTLAAPKQSEGRSQAQTDPIPQVPFQSQIKNQKCERSPANSAPSASPPAPCASAPA